MAFVMLSVSVSIQVNKKVVWQSQTRINIPRFTQHKCLRVNRDDFAALMFAKSTCCPTLRSE